MGLLGGVLLMSGYGAMLLGMIGIIINLFLGQWSDAGVSLLIFVGGLVAGATATAILE